MFFRKKLFNDLWLLNDQYTRIERTYVCTFFEELTDRNIVIYGAGEVGRDYYKQLSAKAGIHVDAWVDKKYSKIVSDDFKVLSPESLLTMTIDCIVIAVADRCVANEIMKELVEYGMSKDKLLWKKPDDDIHITLMY